jgi:translation initiation factor 2B subunit (eIF-2B alpha/beta/delta family)
MSQANQNVNNQGIINQGIIVSNDGTFHAGQVAVGQGAQAIKNTYNLANQLQESGQEQIAQAITELLKSLESQNVQDAVKEQAAQEIQAVAEEAQKEKPNKFTLKGLLTSLKESVGSVAEIAEKLTVLQKAIALMMGIPTL